MLNGGSTRKMKNQLPMWQECHEFRHDKNFCYLYYDPVADSYAKLIPIYDCLKGKGGVTDTHFWSFSFTSGRKW